MQKLTKEQAIVLTAYTGVTCCPFSDFHKECEKRFGRPIFTHEFSSEKLCEEIKEAFKADFMDMCTE